MDTYIFKKPNEIISTKLKYKPNAKTFMYKEK